MASARTGCQPFVGSRAVLSRFFRRAPEAPAAEALYRIVVEQARRPEYYSELGVPDSLDGRFDLIALHAFLVMRRLRREGAAGAPLSQAVFDRMFADMDQSLRELGVGDTGVARRVKRMAEGFLGRVAAYDGALAAADREALERALARNVYGTVAADPEDVAAVAGYVIEQDAALAAWPLGELAQGRLRFGPPPERAHRATAATAEGEER